MKDSVWLDRYNAVVRERDRLREQLVEVRETHVNDVVCWEQERGDLRAQLAQLQKAVRLLLDSEDGSGRLQHNIGVPCGLCEAHAQIKATLADLPDAPKEKL